MIDKPVSFVNRWLKILKFEMSQKLLWNLFPCHKVLNSEMQAKPPTNCKNEILALKWPILVRFLGAFQFLSFGYANFRIDYRFHPEIRNILDFWTLKIMPIIK